MMPNNSVLTCTTSYLSREWPYRICEGSAIAVEMTGDDASDRYPWQIVVTPAQLPTLYDRMQRAGMVVTVVGTIPPPAPPPPPRWPSLAAACDDLADRYVTNWEAQWTAQEAADYAWLREMQRHHPHSWQQTNPLDRALAEAHERFTGRSNLRDDLRRVDEDAHYLAVINSLRQRAGLYPVTADGKAVLPPITAEGES